MPDELYAWKQSLLEKVILSIKNRQRADAERIKIVLNLRKHLINIGRQLDFQLGTLFYGFLPETYQSLQIHHIEIKETDESKIGLHHKSFSNHVSVDLICLSFTNVIFSHLTGFDGGHHTLGKAQ